MTDDSRPNPDALLAAIHKEEAAKRQGRLKVFLGMSPGVGKTYAMLEAARRELASGRDVVIGYVETHRRKETDALAEGLPTVPRRKVDYRGVTLSEMDLDAVLARHPQLALVDELAHTNAPGSRHPKRYQDVRELLDAGIDVFTTLNVQHVGSRAEIVREFTGATIQETVPDSVLDDAEIELVDLPPGELLKRLAEGKVYISDRAAAAANNFFRQGNLIALRELALRLAAEHVGQNVRDYLASRQIAGPWKTGQRLLVAISPSPLSESMARWTRRLADNLQARWLAVYVDTGERLSEAEQTRLQNNLALARELGAEVIATAGYDIVNALLRVARQQNVTQIVVGKPARWRLLDLVLPGRSVLGRLIRESGSIDVHCVRADVTEPRRSRAFWRRIPHSSSKQYLAALVTVGLVTVLNFALGRWTGYYTLSLVYLLALLGLAPFVGRGPMLLTGTASALLWNFCFVPPIYTLYIGSFQDGFMFVMFFVVALVIGQLTSRLRAQQVAEREREERATALYLLTRELAEGKDFAELLGVVIRQLGDVFKADVAVLLPDEESVGELVPYPFGTLEVSEKGEGVAAWAFRNAKPAGRTTDTLPSADALYLPLVTPTGCLGVIGLRPRDGRSLSLQQRNLLDSFIRQIALVLDRQRLSDADQNAKLVAESERLGETLLNSVSHELRTPIAVITNASVTLNELPADSDPALRRTLTKEIQEASLRLNRLVRNLLDITRLESGHVKPKLEWCDVSDLIHVALKEDEKELAHHKVSTSIADKLPLVKMDFVLMEQVLNNLLVNAAAYTPFGTSVEIGARAEGGDLILTVADKGPGFPPESLGRVFDKFYRVPGSPAGGTGLGLSIVKRFVEAQSGTVTAQNRPGGGAMVTIRLPLGEPPRVETETDPVLSAQGDKS
jgi:two-component system, OmpR family, sensor histidine kinase KdpD